MHQVRVNRTAKLAIWLASDVTKVGRKCRSDVREKYHEQSLGKYDYSSFVYIIITKNVPNVVDWLAVTEPVHVEESSVPSLVKNATEYCKFLR